MAKNNNLHEAKDGKNKQLIKHQHYIPRMILKRWEYWRVPMSNPFEREDKKKKKLIRIIYCNTATNTEELKDIRDICYVDWLYEYKKDEEIINTNHIENCFGRLENIWTRIIDKVEKELSLSDKEIIWLKILMVKQLMRTPEAISIMTKTTQLLTPKILSKEEADKYYKISAFALGVQVEAQWVFWSYFKYYASTPKLVIFYTNDDYILCDEQPVLCLQIFKDAYPTMYFPVSPHYMLGLIYDSSFNSDNESAVNTGYEYINMDSNMTRWFNDYIYRCGNHIISNHYIRRS